MERERQRLIVTQLAFDHPMMDPQATFIVRFQDVDRRHLPAIEYEDSHSWYSLLGFLFDFPDVPKNKVGPGIRILHSDNWMKRVTLAPNGEISWPAEIWPQVSDLAGHIWYYDFTLDGKLTPRQTPILVDGRNILHEGPDSAEGAVNLGQLPRLPLFGEVIGPDAAIIEAVMRNAAVVRPASSEPVGN